MESYKILKAYVGQEGHGPEQWAIDRAAMQDASGPSEDDIFDEVEEARRIVDEVEEARRQLLIHIRDQYEPGKGDEGWTSDEQALEALDLCVEFDRANALFLMKLRRDDPTCPRGIPWVTKEALEEVPALLWGECKPRNSITRKYVEFAIGHGADLEFMAHLNDRLKTTLPIWWSVAKSSM